MEEFTVIKNGLVLTLDRKSQSGYYNIIIRNGKIFLIDYENKFNEREFKIKNPQAEIIDAKNKLIMPGFFNSKLISTYSLNKLFLKKCTYENIGTWLSLNLIDKYLSAKENLEIQKDLFKISYARSILNGELFVNESSTSVKKEFFETCFEDTDWIEQYFNLTIYDYSILDDFKGLENFISVGFKTDDEINNYSLSSLKKSLAGNKLKLFLDSSLSQKNFDSIKKDFRKPFINVLADMDLISDNTVIINPLKINSSEIEILKKKKSVILISPSDYLNLSDMKTDFDELIFSGLNVIIGTGYTGNNILSELKLLPLLSSSRTISFEYIFRMAVLNPSVVFGISNVTGSVERNKSADLIFFDISDLRNTLMLPDTDSENVCEFIIKNLNTKDISDVILKGKFLIKGGEKLFQFPETLQTKAKEISDRIYSAGKYFEFKEKYLMRGRVNRIDLVSFEEESGTTLKEEIFVDMTETGEYVGEGEFTILRAKEEEFEKPRKREEENEPVINLKEIKSMEDDLNLFEGLEETQQIIKPRKLIKKEKEVNKNTEDIKQVSAEQKNESNDKIITGKDEIETTEQNTGEIKKEETSKSSIQYTKLKFGFKDDE